MDDLTAALAEAVSELSDDVDVDALTEAIEEGDYARIEELLGLGVGSAAATLLLAVLSQAIKAKFEQEAAREAKRLGVIFNPLDPGIAELLGVSARDAAATMLGSAQDTLRGVLRRGLIAGIAAGSLAFLLARGVWALDRNVSSVEAQADRMLENEMDPKQVAAFMARGLAKATMFRVRLVMGWLGTAAIVKAGLWVWRLARQQGVVDRPQVVFETQRDERVCPVCGPRDGMVRDLDGPWPDGGEDPPLHPICRCKVKLK